MLFIAQLALAVLWYVIPELPWWLVLAPTFMWAIALLFNVVIAFAAAERR